MLGSDDVARRARGPCDDQSELHQVEGLAKKVVRCVVLVLLVLVMLVLVLALMLVMRLRQGVRIELKIRKKAQDMHKDA